MSRHSRGMRSRRKPDPPTREEAYTAWRKAIDAARAAGDTDRVKAWEELGVSEGYLEGHPAPDERHGGLNELLRNAAPQRFEAKTADEHQTFNDSLRRQARGDEIAGSK